MGGDDLFADVPDEIGDWFRQQVIRVETGAQPVVGRKEAQNLSAVFSETGAGQIFNGYNAAAFGCCLRERRQAVARSLHPIFPFSVCNGFAAGMEYVFFYTDLRRFFDEFAIVFDGGFPDLRIKGRDVDDFKRHERQMKRPKLNSVENG